MNYLLSESMAKDQGNNKGGKPTLGIKPMLNNNDLYRRSNKPVTKTYKNGMD